MIKGQVTYFIAAFIALNSCVRGGIDVSVKERSFKSGAIAFVEEPDSKLGGPLSNKPILKLRFSTAESGKYFLFEDSTEIKSGDAALGAQSSLLVSASDLSRKDGKKALSLVLKKGSREISRLSFAVDVDTTPPEVLKNVSGIYFNDVNKIKLTWTIPTSWIDGDNIVIRTAENAPETVIDGTLVTKISKGLNKGEIDGPTSFPANYSLFACDEIGNCSKKSDCPECTVSLKANVDFCTDKSSTTDFKKYGEGTVADPYRLCTVSQLVGLAQTSTELSKSFKLMNNIDLSSYFLSGGAAFKIATSTSCYYGALDAFTGIFDGNGKTINGFKYLNAGVDEVGLFSCAIGATIKNLLMTNVNIQAGQFVGAVVSRPLSLTMDNVSVSGVVQGTNYVGGVVGYSERASRYLRVSNSAAVTGSGNYVGGIGGYTNDYIHMATNSGVVAGSGYVGGINGTCGWGVIDRSTNSANVSGTSGTGYVGGLSGQCLGLISNSSSSAGVTITSVGQQLGGLVGQSQSVIENCFSASTVINTGAGVGYTGGLGGNAYYIYNSYSSGNVNSSGPYTGGLAGSGSATNSYATGNVVSTGSSVGGVFGQMFRNSTRVFSTGNVTGNGSVANVGPIAGTLVATYTLTNSYSLSSATCSYNNGVTPSCNSLGTGGGTYPTVSSFYLKTNAPLNGWDFTSGTTDGINDFWIESPSSVPKIWFESDVSSPIPFTGSGTESSPYLIGSIADFNSIQSNPRWIDKVFKLNANLDFQGQTIVWPGTNEGWFAGTFDGASFTISNINRADTGVATGLIGTISASGKVLNLKLANASISSDTASGTLSSYNFGRVASVSVLSGGVVSTGSSVGGLVGFNYGIVEKSDSAVSVSGASLVGGLVGYSRAATVIRSFATGNVTGTGTDNGGLVGSSWYSYIEDSFAIGNVVGSGQTVGGIAGSQIGHAVRRSYSTGNVTGNGQYVGGLIGYAASGTNIVDSFSAGEVRNTNPSTGLLLGVLLDTSTQSNNFVLSGVWCDSNSATAGVADACNSYGVAKSSIAEFYSPGNLPLSNWDFTSIWKSISNGLPTLRSN